MKNLFLLPLLILIASCSTEYNQESLIKDILNNKSEKIGNEFYKSKRFKLRRNDLEQVIKSYGEKINTANLTQIEFSDELNLKKQKREGYLFVDKYNNIVYSITYKFLEIKGKKRQINYINFRSSIHDLPCIKFPTSTRIKCIKGPEKLPLNPDSLRQIYPKDRYGHTFYHSELASKKFLLEHQDSLKKRILFNLGNLKVKNNLEQILQRLGEKLDLSQYTFTEQESHGEPTINIVYDKGYYNIDEVNTIKKVLEQTIGGYVRVESIEKSKFSFGSVEPNLMIGGIYYK